MTDPWGPDVEFESWYCTTHPRLVSWLTVAAGETELARDAASEAFARAFSRWDRVGKMSSPDGWVYRVGLNVLRRQLRRREIEKRLLRHVTVGTAPSSISPEVWEAVRALPLRQRTAIALRYVLDLPQAEIADVMGIAPGTVSATLVAARRRLAELLAEPSEEEEVSGEAC